ncbi:hypothetical protein [Celeribacter ethanolicus]|uniref:hypothetical protein n=1 Tax=Celeribacter ethanolicus TaxID=1758178 RepID=UPI000A955E31|nr:hypothetical protein [Celeribacter ethanolicus]
MIQDFTKADRVGRFQQDGISGVQMAVGLARAGFDTKDQQAAADNHLLQCGR